MVSGPTVNSTSQKTLSLNGLHDGPQDSGTPSLKPPDQFSEEFSFRKPGKVSKLSGFTGTIRKDFTS